MDLVKFAMGTLVVVLLGGCSSSKGSVLGEAPTSTERVIKKLTQPKVGEGKAWLLKNRLPEYRQNSQYHLKVNQSQNIWAPRTQYLENRRLQVYIYPQRDDLGNVVPGYAIEMPLYQRVHSLMPGEF